MGLVKILLADYSGHPFQVQLARELARRGHTVRHVYSASFQTPKGNLTHQPGDPEGFEIVPVRNVAVFAKGTFYARRRQEIEIGHAFARQVADFRPDAVVSNNAPLDTQRVFQKAASRYGAKFVFWLQDIYSEAISRVIPRKLPVAGHAIAAWYRHLEFSMLKSSDRIVAITQDFVPILTAKGVASDRIAVIENWAPADELPHYPRDNDWAASNMPEGLRIIERNEAGFTGAPGEDAVLLGALACLAAEPDLRKRLGDNGRAYAHKTFDIGEIGDRFCAVLQDA
ncbi:glycosyltransferase [Sphingomonas sp. IC081]|uniref:glycosyltransferase n=1 Tax=Sphingomonas sp. IC081 TaxID=304378 RepID=UPI0021AF864E|nr:glycosyltransferase [Sphingomonas sp. IC081]